jgi:amino acid transporter
MPFVELPLPPGIGENREPKTFFDVLRWLIFGAPLASRQSERTLLPKIIALPTLCSDAISSVAYGGQQILLVLCAAGLWLPQYQATYTNYTMQISWAIAILLIIVAASYRQTIFAYPGGGGSYTVSKDNLGTIAGLIAAGALLIDYVLTVSVSVASGMQNLKDVPLFAGLHIGNHLVPYCIGAIVVIVFANLRGLRESGTLFAIPTYVFIVMCYLMIVCGLVGPFIGWHFHPEFVNQIVPKEAGGTIQLFHAAGLAVLLRAFANGCSAMTGVEAVANGIPAFKEPKSQNAAVTLTWMAVILGTIFMGVSLLSAKFHVVYWEHLGLTAPAVIDQLSGMVFGKEGPWSWAYVITQLFTALVLIVAAQTSFADFPRLASILARDRFLPRQLANVGDKLAFNNGIILLGIFSSLFIVLERGSVDLLIPFFAIGVFLAFTMSQAGMVRHWFKTKGPGWKYKAVANGMGSLATGLVVVDIAFEKFLDGAWAVFVVVAILLALFLKIHSHYAYVKQQLNPAKYTHTSHPIENIVLVLVEHLHAGTLNALDYAKSISPDCMAIHVETDPTKTLELKCLWEKYVPDMTLINLESPYRSLLLPIMRYLDTVHEESPYKRITVVVSEFVPTEWWAGLLHGNTGLLLKLVLLRRKDVVVANVRYWLDDQGSSLDGKQNQKDEECS